MVRCECDEWGFGEYANGRSGRRANGLVGVTGSLPSEVAIIFIHHEWADPRGNAIRGRPVDGVEQAHSTCPGWKNTGNFIGPKLGTVAEITLQRTDTTHDLSSESREAIAATPQSRDHPLALCLPISLATKTAGGASRATGSTSTHATALQLHPG